MVRNNMSLSHYVNGLPSVGWKKAEAKMAKKKAVAKKMVNGKKVTRKMEHSAKKAGFYKHGDPRFGDIYEK